MSDPSTSSTSSTKSAASAGGPADPGSVATARRHPSKRHKEGLTPASRARPYYRYGDFLQALKTHLGDVDFPTFFGDVHFVDEMGRFLSDSKDFDAAKYARAEAESLSRAMSTRAGVFVDDGTAALIAYYGPTATKLADFGIRPKRPPTRRRRHVVAATTGPSTPASSSAGEAGAGTATAVTTTTGA